MILRTTLSLLESIILCDGLVLMHTEMLTHRNAARGPFAPSRPSDVQIP